MGMIEFVEIGLDFPSVFKAVYLFYLFCEAVIMIERVMVWSDDLRDVICIYNILSVLNLRAKEVLTCYVLFEKYM